MERYGKEGFHFTFRFCTYEGHTDMAKMATPQWVYDAGAKSYLTDRGAIQPEYADPIFLEKLENFMKVYGEKYDGDERVEFVDIGTFGTWGEGHTWAGTGAKYPFVFIKSKIDLHVKYFPHTRIIVNDDMLTHVSWEGADKTVLLADYTAALGMGIRDDSIMVDSYTEEMGYDTLRSGYLFDHFWETAPVDIEFEHYSGNTPDRFCEGSVPYEALRRTHATYAGFHGWIDDWLRDHRLFHNYIANRLGYWYFLEGVEVPPLKSGIAALVTLTFTNRGFAPAYNRYPMKITFRDKVGNYHGINTEEGDNCLIMPDRETAVRLPVSLIGVPAGEYELCFGMFEKDVPIKLGMNSETVRDGGYYALCNVTVE